MADLSPKDTERAQFAFSIYDFDGNETIDAFYLGDVLRALSLTPSQKSIEKAGGTKRKGEKKLKLNEFLTIFSQVKKDKEMGTYGEYMECFRLYDKPNTGKIISKELVHILQGYGEALTNEEAQEIMKDCLEPEDEDGFVTYPSFLKNILAGPFPE